VYALENIGEGATVATPALRERLKDENRGVREAAQRALQEIESKCRE
jgi:HEAT repeat protein